MVRSEVWRVAGLNILEGLVRTEPVVVFGVVSNPLVLGYVLLRNRAVRVGSFDQVHWFVVYFLIQVLGLHVIVANLVVL